jgi:serine/threonine-protein kinase
LTISGYGSDLSLTPDGSRLVYVGNGGSQLFVRALEALDPVPIATGSSMVTPFVSPDGQWVGYVDGAYVMKKVAITGGPPVTLPGRGRGGAVWLPDNTIVYGTGSAAAGLLRISAADDATNAAPETLTTPNTAAGEASHLWPEMLPGGQAVLFTITSQTGGLDSAQIALLDLRTRKQKVLLRGGSSAHYVAGSLAAGSSGHLVYVVGGTLRAIPFDLTQLETRGPAVPVVPSLLTDSLGGGNFTEAADGTLMYVDAPDSASGAARDLIWVDRAGHEETAAPPGAYSHVSLSPDGSRVALTVENNGMRHISIWDVRRKVFTRLNFDRGRCICVPIWTRDGRTIVFQATVADSPVSMWSMPADGSGKAERLIQNIYPQLGTSISPDGKYLVFHEANLTTNLDILQMALDGTRRVTPLLNSKSWEGGGKVSPDGRWIAYECCTEKQSDIYVSPYPNTQAGQWQVSTGGGKKALWSSDSKELFFVAANLALMRVAVEATGSAWQASNPSQLFDSRYVGNLFTDQFFYAIANDGQRFLMIKPPAADPNGNPPKVIVVQHWNDELLKLAPPK